jgi:flagella basal body P-ring formation protein FlgA
MSARLFTVILIFLMVAVATDPVIAGEDLDARLKDAITRAVTERNGFPAEKLEITIHTARLPETAATADRVVAQVPDYDDAIGAVTLKVTFTKDGETLARISAPIRVKVFEDALVTTRRLNRHDILHAGDLRRERVDITNLVKWVQTESDSVLGRRTTRTINPGTIVESRWLAEVPLVSRGDRITMAKAANGVSVTGMAVALEDGYKNQEISVKAEWANRILRAVVVDAGTVTPVP